MSTHSEPEGEGSTDRRTDSWSAPFPNTAADGGPHSEYLNHISEKKTHIVFL